MTRESSPAALRSTLMEFLKSSGQDPTPHFNLQIAWYPNYDALFAEKPLRQTAPDALAAAALSNGRVLLCGRGGAAKTVVTRRLALALNHDAAGTVAPLVQLRGWTNDRFKDWPDLTPLERLDILLAELGPSGVALSDLDALPAETPKLIIIDGLNEVTLPAGHQIIEAADEFATVFAGASVLVTDRLVRRQLPNSDRWAFATVAPLSEVEIDAQWRAFRGTAPPKAPPQVRDLWSSPYFLDAALNGDSADAGGSARTLLHNLQKHGGLHDAALLKASATAFEAYANFESRVMPLGFAREQLGDEIIEVLKQAKALVVGGEELSFSHQLQHDALAANHFAAYKDLWNTDGFDALTFHASSFDALSMALELITNTEDADAFVRAAYDWNIYGAAYATAESQYDAHDSVVSPEMQHVIIAMLSIRLFDRLTATRTKSEDALHLFPRSLVEPYLSARNFDDVRAIVAGLQASNDWFADWQRIFVTPVSEYGVEAVVAAIETPASLQGWTAANVLRQGGIDAETAARLREALARLGLGKENRTIRWRLVHALGGDPTVETANTLLQTLVSDEVKWVRYGAARALVEVAAGAGVDLRKHVFEGLTATAERIVSDEYAFNELLRSLFVADAPIDWGQSVAAVILAMYDATDDFEIREQLRDVVARLKKTYGYK